MSKDKLLKEATIRKFMKLANIGPLANNFLGEEKKCPKGWTAGGAQKSSKNPLGGASQEEEEEADYFKICRNQVEC